MAIIPGSAKVLNQYNNVNTTYGGSAAMKAQSRWYTMDDVIETINASTGLDQNELDALNGANHPDASNVFATMMDLPSGLEGTSYLYVTGDGTATENYDDFAAALSFAHSATPYGNPLSDTNRFTIILGPGTYDDGSNVLGVADRFVDVYSLTGERDVILPRGFVIFESDVKVNGIDTQNSPFTIVDGLSNLNISNCKGSDASFGDSMGNITLSQSTFENCVAGRNSFGSQLSRCTFKNCTSGRQSFGYSESGVIDITCEANYFENCTSDGYSFFNYTAGPAFNIITITGNEFVNCKAQEESFVNVFASKSSILNNKFKNCTSFDKSFAFCIGGDFIVDSNTFKNCEAIQGNNFISYRAMDTYSIQWISNTIDDCKSDYTSFLAFDNGGGYNTTFNYQNQIFSNDVSNCRMNKESGFIWSEGAYDLSVTYNNFYNCVGEDATSGGYFISTSNTGNGGLYAEGNTFKNCISAGVKSFIGCTENVIFTNSNKFYDCSGGEYSFLSNANFGTSSSYINDKFYNCTSNSNASFGLGYVTLNINGMEAYNCVSGGTSFACEPVTMVGLTSISIKFFNCIGGSLCFGYAGSNPRFSGDIYYCKSGDNFPSMESGYYTRLSIDGSQNIINS